MKNIKIILLIGFLMFLNSQTSLGDKIIAEDLFAIGYIDVDCDVFSGEGFCEKIYRIERKENFTRLLLFYMLPKYNYCNINCSILSARLHNTKGKRLNYEIIKDTGDFNYLKYLLLIFFIIFVVGIFIFKQKKSKNKKF